MSEASKNMTCIEFEELVSDYLENTLGKAEHRACSTHVIGCSACHELLNDVREAVEACRTMSAPSSPLTSLEMKILERTTPGILMGCEDFEEHLTDYLDGFLEASLFHRWERHAAACATCTDLPGTVVRSIAACYTMKADELPLPAGLNEKILAATSNIRIETVAGPGAIERIRGWLEGLKVPMPVPQFATALAIGLCAFMFFVDGASADGSVRGVYAKGFELASETYRQGADVVLKDPTLFPQSDSENIDAEAQSGGGSK